jgi:transposase
MPSKHTLRGPSSPDGELTETQPARAGWTAAEKLAILTEYESFPHGDPRRGALLRRVGAYTSHISKWRKQRDRGALASLTPQSPGRKPAMRDPLQDELQRLRTENARLQERLAKAETVIEIQKKVAALLGVEMPVPPTDDR